MKNRYHVQSIATFPSACLHSREAQPSKIHMHTAQLIKLTVTLLRYHKNKIFKAQLMKFTFTKLSSHKIQILNAQLS